jgi:hypothetical protein
MAHALRGWPDFLAQRETGETGLGKGYWGVMNTLQDVFKGLDEFVEALQGFY